LTATKESTSLEQCQINVDLFFDSKGIVHKEFDPSGQTLTGKFYCDVLRQLRENIRRKHPDKWRNISWALHHHNAPAHVLLVVQQFLASMTTVIPHPPYSSVLTTCAFLLFPKIKHKIKGSHFDSTEEIQTESQDVMKMLMQNGFQLCFPSWKSCWDHCINAQGDYFEGGRGEQKSW